MPEKRYDRVRLEPRAQRTRRALAPAPVGQRVSPSRNSTLQALVRRSSQGAPQTPRLDAFAAPPAVEQQLQSSRGNGQPLPSPARERMESAFGASFEGVTLHTDGDADSLTRQVDAVAFTHGRDIYFSSGSFAPESTGGQKLLAHELTHVVQQRSGRKVTVGAAHDPAESEADQVAEAVMQRLQGHAARQSRSGGTVARQAVSQEDEAQAVRRQEPDEEEEEVGTVRRQAQPEEDEPAQGVRRQAEADDEELAQPLRRQHPDEEEEEVGTVRRQAQPEADEPAQAVRRYVPLPGAEAQAGVAAPEQAAAEPEAEANVLIEQGCDAQDAGDLDTALGLFQQVMEDEQAPPSARDNATFNAASVYEEQGDDRSALELYRALLERSSLTDVQRARVQAAVGRLEGGGEGEAEAGAGVEPEEVEGGAVAEPQAPEAGAPEAEPAAGAAEEVAADPTARAIEIYNEGVQAGRAGIADHALRQFQLAIESGQLPDDYRAAAVWGMAVCYERMGNAPLGAMMYRTYLEMPGAVDERRVLAQERAERMESRLSAGGTAAGAEAPAGARVARQESPDEELEPLRRQEEDEDEDALAVRRALIDVAAMVTPAAGPAPAAEAAPAPASAAQEAEQQSLYQQGVQAYREGDRSRALELFQRVIASPDASEGERASAMWNVGRIYQDQGNNAAALAMYRAYLAQPSISDERRAVAQEIVERLEREQAASGSAADVESAGGAQPAAAAPAATEAAAAATPERTPSDPRARADALYQQAVQAYRAGELRQALELWQQVLDIDQAPESSRASTIWNIGRVYQDMGNAGAALTMYRTFLAQPSISDERREVAQRIVEEMEGEQAASGAASEAPAPAGAKAAGGRETLPSDPEQRVQALRGLATQAYQSGDYATALEHFQQLMRTAGLEGRAYAETLYNMAQCYRRMGNNGAAIDMYRGFMAQPDAAAAERERAQRLIAMCQH